MPTLPEIPLAMTAVPAMTASTMTLAPPSAIEGCTST
jgi:hypothetical protein